MIMIVRPVYGRRQSLPYVYLGLHLDSFGIYLSYFIYFIIKSVPTRDGNPAKKSADSDSVADFLRCGFGFQC